MKWTIKLVFEAVPGSPAEHELGIIERAEEISPATVGLTIVEGKALLASLQEQVVTAQIQQHVATIKYCPQCEPLAKFPSSDEHVGSSGILML